MKFNVQSKNVNFDKMKFQQANKNNKLSNTSYNDSYEEIDYSQVSNNDTNAKVTDKFNPLGDLLGSAYNYFTDSDGSVHELIEDAVKEFNLPKKENDALVNAIYTVQRKHKFSFTGVDAIVKHLDEIIEELMKEDIDFVIIADCIIKNYTDYNINLDNEYGKQLVEYLFTQQNNGKIPFDELIDINNNTKPIRKINPLIRFIRKTNKSVDLSYSNILKIFPDFDNILKDSLKETLSDFGITISGKKSGYENLWNSFINDDADGLYNAIHKLCPDVNDQLSEFIKDMGVNPKKIDIDEALRNICEDPTEFVNNVKYVIGVDTSDYTFNEYMEYVGDVNDLLLFLGASQIQAAGIMGSYFYNNYIK